ncbi:coiled-coil domain-containing protein 55-domain containing protein [Chytridium lagenaria]|nr:coiled-coil domain-containing protein 55-domain containing protein [Chytridium lagenaria]
MTDPPKKNPNLLQDFLFHETKPSASAFNDPHSDSNSDDDATNLPKTEKATINRNLLRSQIAATNTAKIAALHAKALEEDPNVVAGMVKKERDLGDGTTDALLKKPKYVEKIFAASVARKIALEQAEDRKVQKEREKEGEMFKDKDAFVTEAYKQRQLELKKIEEEEKLREGDMTRFYRTLLDSHDRLSKAGRQLSPEEIARLTAEREVREKEEALELERKIALSLASGDLRLNASDEMLTSVSSSRRAEEKARREAEERQRAKREEERRRREEEKEKRREEAERQEEEERERRKREREKEVKEMAVKMARKTTEETISEARKRYLARKAAEKGKKEESEEESD